MKLFDPIHYVVGFYRYGIFFQCYWWKFMPMRKRIREEIIWRITMSRNVCIRQGSCETCGCLTPHLQMANKSCDDNCYPTMSKNNFQWQHRKRIEALDYCGKLFATRYKMDEKDQRNYPAIQSGELGQKMFEKAIADWCEKHGKELLEKPEPIDANKNIKQWWADVEEEFNMRIYGKVE